MFEYCGPRNISTQIPLWMLTRDYENNYLVMKLTPTTMDDYTKGAWADVDNSLSSQVNLCCSMDQKDCYCPVPVTKLDSFDFDNFMGKLNVYVTNTSCETCDLYYDTACPSYSQAIVKYMTDTKLSEQADFEATIDGVNCTSFLPFNYETVEDTYYS